MPIEFVLGIISLPVLAVAALAYYFGVKGIENKKKIKDQNRKAIENELIQNRMWKLVGADSITLDKIIHFLEDERIGAKMPEEERIRKLGLLRNYKKVAMEPKRDLKNIPDSSGKEWSKEIWNDEPIVGLDEPLNYDSQGWARGLPASIDK